jgi:hypothetical protein
MDERSSAILNAYNILGLAQNIAITTYGVLQR